jgi:DNA-binding response OmpR family regulator
MNQVSMTHPECLRHQCRVNGTIVPLSPMETDLLAALLITKPDRVLTYETMIELLWPNPDTQALNARKIMTILKYRLQLKGVVIVTTWGRGYTIPERNRGGRPARPPRVNIWRDAA